jgi:hypothetical protein
MISCITRYPVALRGESTEEYLCDECLAEALRAQPLGADGYTIGHQEHHDCEHCGELGRIAQMGGAA